MSTPNPDDLVDVGASFTTPIATDESTADMEVKQVDEATTPSEENQVTKSETKRRKRRFSTVWEDVREGMENGKKILKCNHCHQHLSISKGAPTITYKRHIAKGATQSISSFESIGSSSSLLTYNYDKDTIKDITTKMILVHEYPFRMVEHKLFRIHNKMFNPKYEPFDCLAIRDHAMELYVEEKEKMKVMFTGVGRVSLTFNLWTSNQNKGYMCITGHFLNAEWKLQNRILNFRLVPPPHSGVVIADKMFECLSEWGIENKISTITFDNASSNDATIRSLKEQFQRRGTLYFGGKIFHVSCCVHILNILVQDGLSPLNAAIENVRESVKFITLTPLRLHKFNEVVKAMSLPTVKSLILDCDTQWNSTFHMLERALFFKDVFSRYAVKDTSCCSVPSEDDWEIAHDVCKFLSIFHKVIGIFSDCEYTTSNLYFPKVWKIKKILDDMANNSRDFMKIMVQKMKEKFDKYWKECNLFMVIAAVLDPRNKMMFIEYEFAKLYKAEELGAKLASIQKELHMLYDDYVAKGASDGSGDNGQDSSGGTNRIENDLDRIEFEKWVTTVSVVQPNRKEIDIYLEEDVLMGGGKEFDVLSWWKSSTSKFPTLSKMARDILSIPVTIVHSESAFSAGLQIISDDQASLGDETVEGLLCASNWLRVEFQV